MTAAKKSVDAQVEEAVVARTTELPPIIPLDELTQLRIENAALRVDLARGHLRDCQREVAESARAQLELMRTALDDMNLADPETAVRSYSYDAERKVLVRVVRSA